MADKLRWGVLGAARIATVRVIPAMQQGAFTEVVAIASRDGARAQEAARALGVARSYGSYEDLLADPDVDAIYIPLPNHMHVEWTTRAANAGKHVLCEKPIALSAAEAQTLLETRDRTGVYIQEGFMVATHPQWEYAVRACRNGDLGDVRAFQGSFSFYNDDVRNIRNVAAFGGGGLMDVGCYLVTTSRLIFGATPVRACSIITRDPASGVDVVASMLLEFPSGQATGVCGTRLVANQRVQVFGTRARLEIEIPFNAPAERPTRLWIDDGRDVLGGGRREVTFDTCNQYRIQGDRLSRAILDGTPQPYPLEQSIENMRVLDALFESARVGGWVDVH